MRQSGCKPGHECSEGGAMSQTNQRLEQFMTELTLRMVTHRWKEFDVVFECANRICDRYEAEQRAVKSAEMSSNLP
jgi:hypothetical protein